MRFTKLDVFGITLIRYAHQVKISDSRLF